MCRDLLDLVRELNTLNDDNLADRVIENSDVQWCLSELQDILEEIPTLTPPNEWVSVEERLPTIEKDYGGYGSVSVNIFNGKSVLPMDYESSVVRGKKVFRWKYPWNRIYDGEPITHWRPLPEPPKKEG